MLAAKEDLKIMRECAGFIKFKKLSCIDRVIYRS